MFDFLFGSNKPAPKVGESHEAFVARLEQEVRLKFEQLEHNHSIEVDSLNKDHELENKDWKFKLDHLESEEIKTLTKQLTEANTKISVFEKEVEMMKSIVDLNADIVDVKDIINKLFEKLPTINLDTIQVGNGNNKAK